MPFALDDLVHKPENSAGDHSHIESRTRPRPSGRAGDLSEMAILRGTTVDASMGGTMHLVCKECQKVANQDARGWRTYLGASEDGELEALTFCPECAEREFGHAQPADEDHGHC